MSITAIVAEMIPEIIEKAVEGGGELIIAPGPNAIATAASAASGLPIVQTVIGLACAACLGLALLALGRSYRIDTQPRA
jgi:hypothetical protein